MNYAEPNQPLLYPNDITYIIEGLERQLAEQHHLLTVGLKSLRHPDPGGRAKAWKLAEDASKKIAQLLGTYDRVLPKQYVDEHRKAKIDDGTLFVSCGPGVRLPEHTPASN